MAVCNENYSGQRASLFLDDAPVFRGKHGEDPWKHLKRFAEHIQSYRVSRLQASDLFQIQLRDKAYDWRNSLQEEVRNNLSLLLVQFLRKYAEPEFGRFGTTDIVSFVEDRMQLLPSSSSSTKDKCASSEQVTAVTIAGHFRQLESEISTRGTSSPAYCCCCCLQSEWLHHQEADQAPGPHGLPIEILRMVYKKLDARTLFQCMTISNTWKAEIADILKEQLVLWIQADTGLAVFTPDGWIEFPMPAFGRIVRRFRSPSEELWCTEDNRVYSSWSPITGGEAIETSHAMLASDKFYMQGDVLHFTSRFHVLRNTATSTSLFVRSGMWFSHLHVADSLDILATVEFSDAAYFLANTGELEIFTVSGEGTIQRAVLELPADENEIFRWLQPNLHVYNGCLTIVGSRLDGKDSWTLCIWQRAAEGHWIAKTTEAENGEWGRLTDWEQFAGLDAIRGCELICVANNEDLFLVEMSPRGGDSERKVSQYESIKGEWKPLPPYTGAVTAAFVL